jgi:hypothetical protein
MNPIFNKIMDNKETVCMEIQAKHDIIQKQYLLQYISDKIELEKTARILTDKVLITHSAMYAVNVVLPDEVFKYIKDFIFTEGSKVEKELMRIKKSMNYKIKSLMVDRIDELLIYQDIEWK